MNCSITPHSHCANRKEKLRVVLSIVTLLVTMYLILMLGKLDWSRKGAKYYLIAIVAALQTAMLIFAMFTMQPPKY